MKPLLITAAALAFAAPAFAQSQLETKLGVAPGVFGTAKLAALHFAQSNDDTYAPPTAPAAGTGSVVVATANAASDTADFALRHFDQDHASGDGARYARSPVAGNPLVFSTSDTGLAALAKAKLSNGERGDN